MELKTPDIHLAQMWEVVNSCHVKTLFKDEVTGHSLDMVTSINDRHGKASTSFQVWKTAGKEDFFMKKVASRVLDSVDEAIEIYNRVRKQWHEDKAFEALSDEEQDAHIKYRNEKHQQKNGQ